MCLFLQQIKDLYGIICMKVFTVVFYFCLFDILVTMSFKKVPRRNCAMPQCTNSWYTLEQWMSNVCQVHGINFGTGCCICPPPFKLIPFPTERRDPVARRVWINTVNRKSGGKNWIPNENSRLCSTHFVDGEPTPRNPYPTLNIGYTPLVKLIKARPPPKERNSSYIPTKRPKVTSATVTAEEHSAKYVSQATSADHSYTYPPDVALLPLENEQDKLINELQQRVKSLKLENLSLKNKVNNFKKKSAFDVSLVLKNDRKVKFYTGFPSVKAFNDVFRVLQGRICHMKHWKGPKRTCNPVSYKRVVSSLRKLNAKQEFILCLMKLRLGLLLEDLADRFCISTSLASNIFTTWVKVLSQTLGSLVFNPPKAVVRSNLPPSFQNKTFHDVRHIIDCSEIFLEKPSNLNVAAKTWSDYKHHHTGKFLVSINPSGMINFISECWGGRVSDKVITNQSGFLNLIEPYDAVLADRGFPIREELTLKRATLLIPPGRKGVNQMSSSDVQLTKAIAHRRIYIEQAIRRMKCFRILKYEVPLSLMHHLDDIV